MQSQQNPRLLPTLHKARSAAVVVLLAHLTSAWPAIAALESGVFQTLPGATVEERGDAVPNGSRIVPLSATLTFDLAGPQPSLTAVIPNAVLEGGSPFALTVQSLTGAQLLDGSYSFTGDYLRDITPSGTQYLFDWRFSSAEDGSIVWNGITGWAGGHIWQVTISDLTIVPEPGSPTLILAAVGILAALRASQKTHGPVAAEPHRRRGERLDGSEGCMPLARLPVSSR